MCNQNGRRASQNSRTDSYLFANEFTLSYSGAYFNESKTERNRLTVLDLRQVPAPANIREDKEK